MPSPRTRKERLDYILHILRKTKQADAKGLFSDMSLKFGVSKRTFQEYLSVLATAGKIIYDEDSDTIILPEEE